MSFELMLSICRGVSASLNSLFDASAVTLSFVLKLRSHEMRTLNGLLAFEIIVTMGTMYFLFSRLRMVIILSIWSKMFSLLSI